MADIHQYKCKNCLGKLNFDSQTQMMKCPFCDSTFSIEEYKQVEQEDNQRESAVKPQYTPAATNTATAPNDNNDMLVTTLNNGTVLARPSNGTVVAKPTNGKKPATPTKINNQPKKIGNKYKVLNYDKSRFNRGGRHWSKDDLNGMVTYRCETCGGEEVTAADTGSTKCPYCDHQMVIENVFEGNLRPEMVIPFKLDKETAMNNYKKYLEGKYFLPKVFKSKNHINELQGVYVPFWVYSANLSASTSQEKYNEKVWTVGNTEYTERKFYDVKRNGEFAYSNIPADASSKIPDELMESIEPFDIADAKPFSTVYLSGYMASRYDETPEDCMDHVMYRAVESSYKYLNNSIGHYSGTSRTDNSFSLHEGSVRYSLFPVWILNTTYNNKSYTFAMNGQTGKFVGDLPRDGWKVAIISLLIGLGLSPILALIGFLFLNIPGLVIGILGAGGLGFLITWLISQKSLKGIKVSKEANAYTSHSEITYKHDKYTHTTKTSRKIDKN